MTRSLFAQGVVALPERIEGSEWNVDEMVDFMQGMSAAFHQSKGPTSAFWCPLKSLHNLVKQRPKNWVSIYNGGGASSICNSRVLVVS